MVLTLLRKLFTIIFLMSFCLAEDVCIRTGPCKCVFSNGMGVDLTPQMKESFLQAQTYRETHKDNPVNNTIMLENYFFFPCTDLTPNTTINPANSTSCFKKLSLYREVFLLNAQQPNQSVYKMDTGKCESLGETTDSVFSASGNALIFKNGPANTTILLQCAQTPNNLQVVSVTDEGNLLLSWYSPEACLKQIEDVGRSLGSTLLIILFSTVIFYLTLGVLTRKFLMGATGMEVIPNLNFWMDLPNLVKDGWAFARNGFKLPNRGIGPTSSPDPNSYDSI